MKKYDVIVIGAGPAGSTVAKKTAEGGLETLLLEKDEFPGQTNACAGGLSPWLLDQIDVNPEIIEREITEIRLFSKDNSVVVPFRSNGVTTRRINFDKFLSEKAVEKGAELRTNEKVTNVSDKVVETKNEKFKGEIIVGADGAKSVVSREMGLNPFPGKLATGLTYEIKTKEEKINQDIGNGIELHCLKDIFPGYAWVFPGKDILNVGIGSLFNKKRKVNLKEKLDKFIEKKGIEGEKISTRGGIVPCSGPRKKVVSDNKLLVGDSAGQTGPLFGEGISYAVANGKIAGEACIRYPQTGSLEYYEKESKKRFRFAYLTEKVMQRSLILTRKLKLFSLLLKMLECPPLKRGAQCWVENR